jgi:hypothetical protein
VFIATVVVFLLCRLSPLTVMWMWLGIKRLVPHVLLNHTAAVDFNNFSMIFLQML